MKTTQGPPESKSGPKTADLDGACKISWLDYSPPGPVAYVALEIAENPPQLCKVDGEQVRLEFKACALAGRLWVFGVGDAIKF